MQAFAQSPEWAGIEWGLAWFAPAGDDTATSPRSDRSTKPERQQHGKSESPNMRCRGMIPPVSRVRRVSVHARYYHPANVPNGTPGLVG